MKNEAFIGNCERGVDLLDLIYIDVNAPFRSPKTHGERYFVIFTHDYSRYGYAYLIKHNSIIFEVFKTFQQVIENELGKKIKILRFDRDGKIS